MTFTMFKEILDFIKTLYPNTNPIPLHAPIFIGNEKKYLNNCIDTGFVSYLGEYVNKFEEAICNYTGSKYAIATVNGTCALQVALELAGVNQGDEVITQALTFVATANAIHFCGAEPIFIDSDLQTLGMSAEKLEEFLQLNCRLNNNGQCINIKTGRIIKACVPVHIFGHPVHIDRIIEICNKFHIHVVEDAAESLGSLYKNQHTGTFGLLGILSFNGNKIITTGGGGMILTNDETLSRLARHITTTAKIPHQWEFYHDRHGYNYRLTNVNAAIGYAQMELLPLFVERKRRITEKYKEFFSKFENIKFFTEPFNSYSNYWLNLVIFRNREERNQFLNFSNNNGVMTRPVWTLMNKLPMFQNCQSTNLDNAYFLEDRGVNIPSSVPLFDIE